MFRLLIVALLPLVSQCLDKQDFVAIQRAVKSVERLKNNRDKSHHNRVVYQSACYEDIGCFSTDGPMKHTEKLPESPDKVGTKFFAYSKSAPATAHEVDPYDSNTWASIAADKPLAVIVHGWRNDGAHPTMLEVKDALLGHEVATVIAVDWKEGADDTLYTQSAVNTELVGRQVAFLINSLSTKKNLSPSKVHLIGFSLGAQVVGFAGKFSQQEYKWKFGRITGLDAAAPLFESYPGSYLTSADADFVDMIHTSAGTNILSGEVGFVKAVGDVDFYPNNGRKQPRCKSAIFEISCDHWSAVLYFEASLTAAGHKCTAYQCNSWTDFVDNKCQPSGESRMGYFSAHHSGRGSHYSHVDKNFPFCLH